MVMLTDLAAAARRSGLPVNEQPGWQTRGHGGMAGTPRSIALHHTAGPRTGEAPSLRVVRDGRSDLPGPLAHLVLGRSGTVYVVAAGQCWHAGATWTANQSNPWAIGIEAEATGVDPWPPGQYDAYLRLVRALCDHYRIPFAAVQGHKEICKPRGRKSDPNFDCNAFRAALGRATGSPAAPAAPPPKKVKPVIIRESLRHGKNYIRLPAMVGAASGLYGRAWLSVSAVGGGTVTNLFQRNTPRDGAPDGVPGDRWNNARIRNGSRVWLPVPSGTEYVELWVDVLGADPADPDGPGGFACIEFEPK